MFRGSQWSPVLETGTIRAVVGAKNLKQKVSMKSGLRDRNNPVKHDSHARGWHWRLNEVRP